MFSSFGFVEIIFLESGLATTETELLRKTELSGH